MELRLIFTKGLLDRRKRRKREEETPKRE